MKCRTSRILGGSGCTLLNVRTPIVTQAIPCGLTGASSSGSRLRALHTEHGVGRRSTVRAEHINPFLGAATAVLQTETRAEVRKGTVGLADGPLVSDDVTVWIGVTGHVKGVVLLNVSERTAKEIVGAMKGEPVAVWDDEVESGIAELGNVIIGRASAELDSAGYPCRISPPTVVVGRGTQISTVHIKRLVIPLETRHGAISIHVALRE